MTSLYENTSMILFEQINWDRLKIQGVKKKNLVRRHSIVESLYSFCFRKLLRCISHFISNSEFTLIFGFFVNYFSNTFGVGVYILIFNFSSSFSLAFIINREIAFLIMTQNSHYLKHISTFLDS